MAERTWLERVLAVPCPNGCTVAGPFCGAHGKGGFVCASRVQAAEEAEAPKPKTGKRHRFGRVVQKHGPFGRTVLGGCVCETVMTVRGSRYGYSHDNGATWTPGPDACPGARP